MGVAPWARTFAAPGFAEEKGHFSVLSALSQFQLGSTIFSVTGRVWGGEGAVCSGVERALSRVLARVAWRELPSPVAKHLPFFFR